jgi:Protein of unknown function (DUF3644)
MAARLPLEATANLKKAREAVLSAVDNYNRPGSGFRSANYIVLMIIAWTALFHAIFAKRKIKPFYRKKNSRRFERIDGDYRTWELKECLGQYFKDTNPPQRKNLELFITLRNKIEHRFLPELDVDIFGECQAMLMNCEALLCEIFGEKQALSASLAFALQFSKTTIAVQQKAMREAGKQHLQSVRRYVDKFRSSLGDDVASDQTYSYKVFLIPKVGSHAKSSDIAVEFVKYDPLKPDEMKQYDRVVAMIKPKQVSVANLGGLRAGDVVRQVSSRIGRPFNFSSHVVCWKHFNTRPAAKSADPTACDNRHCYYDVVHKDYVYTPAWVEFLVGRLSDPATYDQVIRKKAP